MNDSWEYYILVKMINSLIVLLPVVICVALLTLAERHVMGSMQRRVGPNKVGILGVLQPFADGFKLIFKETVIPLSSAPVLFLWAPYMSFYLALLNWMIIPLDENMVVTDTWSGMLMFLAISELSFFGVLFSGWSAKSTFPFLGSLRSTAQMISYSVSLTLLFLIPIFSYGHANFLQYVSGSHDMLIWAHGPMAVMMAIVCLAESNRAPFDLPEAESELVAGFFTEHSAVSFAYFFLAEYTNMITLSTVFFILFFGVSMCVPFLFFFIWMRASLARLRFDQLMLLGWTSFLPITVGYLMFLPCWVYTFDALA